MTNETMKAETTASTRLDVKSLTEDEAAFMAFIDDNMVGQPAARKAALRIFRAIHNPLREPHRPIFSAIFAGVSRSGKNHLVRLLCKWFHGNEKAHVKVNGGEFMERYALSRLIGSPHGYIGHNDASDPSRAPKEGKKDASAILSQHNLDLSKEGSSHDVIFLLVDEWEKMHWDAINIFLAGLDEGESTLANNTEVNFRNVVLIFTSNMGMDEVERHMRRVGFHTEDGRKRTPEVVENSVREAYRKKTSPEFRNRIDLLVVYDELSDDELLDIVGLEFKHLQARVMHVAPDRIFTISVDDETKRFLLETALAGEEGGLSNLKRVLTEHVLEPLGTALRHGHVRMGDAVEVSVEEGEIVFDKIEAGANLDPFKDIPIIGGAKAESVSLSQAGDGVAVLHGFPTVPSAIANLPVYGGQLIPLSELVFLHRAMELRQLARRHTPLMARYSVQIAGDSLAELSSKASMVTGDLVQLIGAHVLSSNASYELPYQVTLTVSALPGQIELLLVRYDDVEVELSADE